MINKYKTFKDPKEITEFLNERDNTLEVVNITCDNNGLWHLFYKEKNGLFEFI